ncbi:hypothetical protein ACWT_4763 [Actinoplanes sp. SE50]|uniref:hypothetical protein n=1 Tax=unclassified Actinoplanes TaxID=2626549 RepID=UPI00023EC124|nr:MULTISPECIES: hypothetical protein [unclassified Actinoplanes]AEV85784.1 hypothetical protein ACPL_4893 [Actinoplanes sp. SE50/110]ATO84178.1 hypothetical protein ACWT_4763 [Actinoplanes sp. SE50]SLM01588.1 hypothetical protein ACSP50_4824 [Actinoplanes sp. SE50/110]
MPAPYAASRRRWFIAVLVLLVVLAVLTGIALHKLWNRPQASGATPTVTTSFGTPSTPPSSSASAVAGAAPQTASTHRVSGTTAPVVTRTTPSGPVIVYFRVSQQPTCPSGTDQVQYPGTPVTLAWKVTGVDKVTLSVDGPGIYDTYDANGSAEINFSCGGEANSYQSHSFLLTAAGKTRKLVVKARVNEIAHT